MELGKRMKALCEMLGISQQNITDEPGSTQSSINCYENDQALPPTNLLLRYADCFDISLDYLFGRTEQPHGKQYAFKPVYTQEWDEMHRFIEMCFEPGSPANLKLKKTMLRVMEGDEE